MSTTGSAGWRRITNVITIAMAIMIPACSEGPTRPTSTQPPVQQPVANAPPVIKSISISTPRIEAGEELKLSAEVEDFETAADRMTYEWSVTPSHGRFVGAGREVLWDAPSGQTTPDVYTLRVSVVEKFMSGLEMKENRTTSSIQVRYNDSHVEIRKMTLDFLSDFANYDASPEQAVRNFSDRCPGRIEQLNAIRNNRRDYRIMGGDFYVDLVWLNEDRSRGDIVAPCSFRDVSKATGQTDTTAGTCLLTSVYESGRWQLCESRFTANPGAADRSNTHP